MKNICIIGAGPVGLWTAIQIKALDPQANITILEKYSEYQRKHPLRVELNSLKSLQFNESEYSAIIKQMQKDIIEKGNQKYDIITGKYINIRTNDLEVLLKETAQKIGVRIENKEFKSLNDISENTQYVIGADGSHSQVRKIICNGEEDNVDSKTLRYVVELKYEAISTNKEKVELQSIIQKYPTQKLMHFFADDYVGKPDENGIYPVSVRFFVNKETYDALGDAQFKKPQTIQDINSDIFPEKLKQDIAIWLNVRKKYNEIIPDTSTIKITKLPLNAYKSKQFSKIVNGKLICVAGDAAGAVPYFRALNGGIERAAMLGQMIINNDNKSVENLSNEYNKRMRRSMRFEIFKAILKDFVLSIIRLYIYISGCVPWQVNKWNKKNRNQLKDENLFSEMINKDEQNVMLV